MSSSAPISPRVYRAIVWMGPAFVVLFLVGIVLARLLPPPSPNDSGQEIAELFGDHTTAIRVGCVMMIVSFAVLAPWGAALAAWTKQTEKGFPLLAYSQLACLAPSVMVGLGIPLFWGVAAFRPDDIDPDTTRMLNDVAWFLVLFAWPPFTLWCAAVGAAILGDRSAVPFLPRWSGYLSVWCAVLLVPAGAMAFFKSGPLAYNGVIAFYIPLGAFCVWMLGMTVVLLQRTRLEEQDPSRVAEPAVLTRARAWLIPKEVAEQ